MKRILTSKPGWLTLAAVLACLTMMVGTSLAVPTIAWTGTNYPSDMSADGSVVVGNSADGVYETFRWTELTGAVLLGRHTGFSGGGAGIPEVSDNGNHISATIATEDSLYATQGIWTKGRRLGTSPCRRLLPQEGPTPIPTVPPGGSPGTDPP